MFYKTITSVIIIVNSVQSLSRHPLYDGRRISWNMTDSAFTPKSGANYRINLGDTLDVLCPSNNFRRSASEPAHKFNIHMVDYNTYKNCDFNTEINQKSSQQVIYRCNNPDRVKMMSLNILQVSPFIDAITFHPDQSYYFITGDDVLCKRGLKMRIRVVEGNNKNVVRLEKTPQLQNTEDDEYYQEQENLNNDYEGIIDSTTIATKFNLYDDNIEKPDLIDEISEFFNGNELDNNDVINPEDPIFQLTTEKIIGIVIIFLILIFIITFLLYLLICKKRENNSDPNPFHYSQTMRTNFDYKPNIAGHQTMMPPTCNNNPAEILPFTLKLPPLESHIGVNSSTKLLRQPQTYQAYFQNENSNNNVNLNNKIDNIESCSRSPNSQNNSGSNLNISSNRTSPNEIVQINLNPSSSLPLVPQKTIVQKKTSSNNDNSNYSISSGYNSDFMRNGQKSPEKVINAQSLSPKHISSSAATQQHVPQYYYHQTSSYIQNNQQQTSNNSRKNSIDILQFNQPWKSGEIEGKPSKSPPLDEVIVQNGQYIVAI